MSTAIVNRSWDLRHLQQFLPVFPGNGADENANIVAPRPSSNSAHHDDNHEVTRNEHLGDFSKIYNYLGTSDLSAADSSLGSIPPKDDYASDGAIHQVSGPHLHHTTTPEFSDGMDGVEGVFGFEQSESVTASESNVATGQHKKDRKKARRAERKAALNAQRTALSESECDSNLGNDTPARKASSHAMMTRSTSSKMQTDHAASNEQAIRAVAEAAARLKEEGVVPDTPCPTKSYPRGGKSSSKALPTLDESAYKYEGRLTAASAQKQPPPSYEQFTPNTQTSPPHIVKTHNPWPTPIQPEQRDGPPRIVKTHNLIPSSIAPSQNNIRAPSAVQHATLPRFAKIAAPTPTIEPITLRSGEDREMALFLKIINDFIPDRKHLVKPANLTTHSSDPAGIHVFVDASNIFIGFVDQLKRSRNIHPLQRVPDVNLSFDSLALLIERRRPVAKRVLVGSTPHIPAFDKAKSVGYEVSVLEKVMKARELTERQIYFKEVDARRSGRKSSTRPPPHKIALQGSVLTPGGSETTTTPQPQFAPVRLVEQGVDEILHLKMMESVLDTEKPGIMVLATGDAAQAEYSSGFAAMVERALRKGWSVELTSWAKNVNSLYRNKAWEAAWGERFRIIELDSYAEELLDM